MLHVAHALHLCPFKVAAFVGKEGPKALLFQKKRGLTADLKALAMKFKGALSIGDA